MIIIFNKTKRGTSELTDYNISNELTTTDIDIEIEATDVYDSIVVFRKEALSTYTFRMSNNITGEIQQHKKTSYIEVEESQENIISVAGFNALSEVILGKRYVVDIGDIASDGYKSTMKPKTTASGKIIYPAAGRNMRHITGQIPLLIKQEKNALRDELINNREKPVVIIFEDDEMNEGDILYGYLQMSSFQRLVNYWTTKFSFSEII